MWLFGRSASQAAQLFTQANYELLPIKVEHVLAVSDLPDLHQDPFDRLLVAQARTEPLRLLTADAQLAAYGGKVEHV